MIASDPPDQEILVTYLKCVKETETYFIRNRAREMGKLHVESNTFRANHEQLDGQRERKEKKS